MLKSAAVAIGGSYAETKYGPTNSKGPLGLSTYAGIVPMVFTGLSLFSLIHGMKVGKARAKYIEKAKEDGEKDVEDRYALPNLYAQGTSSNARAFNCVQRSHQHIFENFTQALATGMVAAVHYPVMAGLSSLAYAVGRITNSIGYANSEGDPMKRYSLPFSKYLWYGLMTNMILSFISSLNMVTGKKLL